MDHVLTGPLPSTSRTIAHPFASFTASQYLYTDTKTSFLSMSPATSPTSPTFPFSSSNASRASTSSISDKSVKSSYTASRPRPRSPTAMYSAFDFAPPKKPKPLGNVNRSKSASSVAPKSPSSSTTSLFSGLTRKPVPKVPANVPIHESSAEPSLHGRPDPGPVQPSSSQPESFSGAHQRSQKMEKLTRTLGEPVPAALVFPALSTEVMMECVTPPPPQPGVVAAPKNNNGKGKERKLPRRASVAVSSFSNLATPMPNITTSLRPVVPKREESLSRSTSGLPPNSQNNQRERTSSRPAPD